MIDDAPTLDAVRGRLLDASTVLLAERVDRLTRERFEPERRSQEELGDLDTLPRGRPVLPYLREAVLARLGCGRATVAIADAGLAGSLLERSSIAGTRCCRHGHQ